MLIVKLSGGLGNQMFQYAFAITVAEKHKAKIKLDLSAYEEEYNKKFGHIRFALEVFLSKYRLAKKREIFFYKRTSLLGSKLIYKVAKNISRKNMVQEKDFRYSERYISKTTNSSYIEGYWQCEKYFNKKRREILRSYKFPDFNDKRNIELQKELSLRNSVSIHVRRGDYISEKANFLRHGVCPIEYYKKAIDIIYRKIKTPFFYIFSDDIEWVQSNFTLSSNITIIDWNINEPYKDMQLMSMCKHNIIANSSFSWWGAWLNPNPEKIVVAPNKWFNIKDLVSKDIIPESWIKI